MKTIVGLDLSLAGTGAARLQIDENGERKVTWGVKGTAPHAKDQRATPDHLWQCERNGTLLNFVKTWCDPKPDLVVIEAVFQGGKAGSAALELSQLAGLVRYWLHAAQHIPFVLVVGQATKKFAGLPKSKPGEARPKGLICKYVQAWGHDTDNDNAADSIAMTYVGAAVLGYWQPEYAYQREVIDAMLKKDPWLADLRDKAVAA